MFNLKNFSNLDENILPINPYLFVYNNSSFSKTTFYKINTIPVELKCSSADLYDKYFYVHKMIQGIKHGLSSVGKSGKKQYKSFMCEIAI